MKKKVFSVFLFVGLCGLVFAQSDLQVIAQVNLLKYEPITLGQLKKLVIEAEKAAKGRKSTFEERKEFLEVLISVKLLAQAAEKNGINVLNSEVNTYFDNSLSQLFGVAITEAQLAKEVKKAYNQSLDEYLISNMGSSVAEAKKMLKEQIMIQKFVMAKKQKEIQNAGMPSDGDIRKYYELNKQNFFRPDMMKLVLVGVIKAGNDSAEAEKIKKLNNRVKQNIKNLYEIQKNAEKEGCVVLTRYAVKSAEGAQILRIDTAALMQIFEKPVKFVSDITDMPDNKQFFVIEEKYDAKLLTLSDVFDPNNPVTIYEAIKNLLASQLQQEAFRKANQDLVQELKTSSNYKILLSEANLKKSLSW